MRGGAFFNGKEGRDDFRTKAQAPLADQNSGRAIASPSYIISEICGTFPRPHRPQRNLCKSVN